MKKSKGGGSETVSVRELQILLGISLNAIYRAVKNGDVPSVRIGTRLLIPRRWVDAKLRGTTASTK
jgi:excisionase family DNA binding protein